jgi:hypothetical protein
MWIVTEEYNAYDQYGEYFIACYGSKPTFAQLKKLIEADDVTIGKLTRGGGRQGTEEIWWNLHEVEEGVNFNED